MDRFLSRTAFLLCFAAGGAGCVPSNDAIGIRVQESRDTEAYGKYRNDLARSNIEREKAGQAPVPFLDREEWARNEAAKKDAVPEK
jgi:hypothetical protein